jgi:hypothetical protein
LPPLSYVGTGGVGASMLVRSKRASNKTKFQFEIEIDALPSGSEGFYVGVDDGTTPLNPFGLPGYSSTAGCLFFRKQGERYAIHNGVQDYAGSGDVQVGDVYSVVVDTVASTVKLYQTRSGTTVQVGATQVIAAPYASFFAVAGSNGDFAFTANFGETAFARPLDTGYGAF